MSCEMETRITEKRWRIILLLIGSSLLCMSMLITAELLISLGVMKISLTSPIELVKNTALYEIEVIKSALVVLAVLLMCISLTWNKVSRWDIIVGIKDNDGSYLVGADTALVNKSFIVIVTLLSVAIGYIKLGPVVFGDDGFRQLNEEDGLIEYLTVLFLSVCFYYTLKLINVMVKKVYPYYFAVLLAVLFFLMVGEEISWGQRILGFSTPESVKNINVQGEFNLHNMYGYFADHLFIFLIWVYGFLFPIMVLTMPFIGKLFATLGIPVPSLGLAIGFLMITLFQDSVVYSIFERVDGVRIPELRELLTAIALMLLMIEANHSVLNMKQPRDSI